MAYIEIDHSSMNYETEEYADRQMSEEDEIRQAIRNGEYYWDGYGYTKDDGVWYNRSGQQLRNPSEYNQFSEGYTPFGDE